MERTDTAPGEEAFAEATPLNLRGLSRPDLEALSALKLWAELALTPEATDAILETASSGWMIGYLESIPRSIGGDRLDGLTLERARRRRRRLARQRGTEIAFVGLDEAATRTLGGAPAPA